MILVAFFMPFLARCWPQELKNGSVVGDIA